MIIDVTENGCTSTELHALNIGCKCNQLSSLKTRSGEELLKAAETHGKMIAVVLLCWAFLPSGSSFRPQLSFLDPKYPTSISTSITKKVDLLFAFLLLQLWRLKILDLGFVDLLEFLFLPAVIYSESFTSRLRRTGAGPAR